MTVKFYGDVAAVKAAIDAGAVEVEHKGLISGHVIPRPIDNLEKELVRMHKNEYSKEIEKSSPVKENVITDTNEKEINEESLEQMVNIAEEKENEYCSHIEKEITIDKEYERLKNIQYRS